MQWDKHIIWDALISKGTKLRPYLDYILDKEIVIQSAKLSVETLKERLNKNPIETANNTIKFLNVLTEDKLKATNIKDRISIITWERKVVSKNHCLAIVEEKIGIMTH